MLTGVDKDLPGQRGEFCLCVTEQGLFCCWLLFQITGGLLYSHIEY